MKTKLVLYTLGTLLIFIAGAMAIPFFISIYYNLFAESAETDMIPLLYSVLITLGIGLLLHFTMKGSTEELSNKEGFAVVTFGWTVSALAGALPYFFADVFGAEGKSITAEFIDCFFESMSGLSTTGSTVLMEIESLDHGILFWRSLTHWLGGMGIIVLAVAILPLLGVGGMQLYKAEAPGPQSDRMTPRIRNTAILLWGVYILFTVVEAILLSIGTMKFVPEEHRESLGEAVFNGFCHAFGTMATGGFATKNASIGQYDSLYIDVVIMFFMFIAGISFSLHYRALRGDFKGYLQDEEFRFYLIVLTVAMVLLTWSTMAQKVTIVDGMVAKSGEGKVVYDSIGDALRYVGFQVLAIITTTGYGTADFEQWPYLTQVFLVGLMFFGGCAGSTGGGMKQVRFLLLIKQGYREIKQMILPHAVLPVKLNGKVIPKETMTNILGFFFIGIALFVLSTLVMAALGMDLISASTAVVATLWNIGPGLGTVGPSNNFAHVVPIGKVVLSLCMLLGRLELYTVLVLFAPALWRK